MIRLITVASLLVAAATPPPGVRITVSDKYARPATIDVYYPEATPLVAGAIDPAELAAELKRLCLDTAFDAARLAAAAPRSAWSLQAVTLHNVATRGVPAFDVDGWYGPAASARIWRTDPAAVKKLPWFVIDSGVMITGPQKPPTPQCNVDVASTALNDWPATVAALDAAIGSPGKPRGGKKWAQAEWAATVGGQPAVIAIRVDDLNKPSQTAHIGVVPSNGIPAT